MMFSLLFATCLLFKCSGFRPNWHTPHGSHKYPRSDPQFSVPSLLAVGALKSVPGIKSHFNFAPRPFHLFSSISRINHDVLPDYGLNASLNSTVNLSCEKNTCPVCGTTLPSRNKFFKHLRFSPCTTDLKARGFDVDTQLSPSFDKPPVSKNLVLLKIGYSCTEISREDVERKLSRAVSKVNSMQLGELTANTFRTSSGLSGFTLATGTQYRNCDELEQEPTAAAIGDTVVYAEPSMVHKAFDHLTNNASILHSKLRGGSIKQWVQDVNKELYLQQQQHEQQQEDASHSSPPSTSSESASSTTTTTTTTTTASATNDSYATNYATVAATRATRGLCVFAKSVLPGKLRIHAEQHCTVRVYDYYLPLRALVPIVRTEDSSVETNETTTSSAGRDGGDIPLPSTSTMTDQSIDDINRRLKLLMNNMLGPKLTQQGGYKFRNSEIQIAHRELRRWHNYYHGRRSHDPITGFNEFKPIVGPTEKAAYRMVDKFYSLGVVSLPVVSADAIEPAKIGRIGNDEVEQEAFMHFRVVGDSFLTGQVRTMIGTIVAVMHGWLPEDFIPYSLRPEVITELPVAPAAGLFLQATRFDWHYNKLPRITSAEPASHTSWHAAGMEEQFRADLLTQIAGHPDFQPDAVSTWLRTLKNVICPRIIAKRRQFDSGGFVSGITSDTLSINSRCPPTHEMTPQDLHHERSIVAKQCESVLKLLRDADASGLWPTTTAARQKVIQADVASGSIHPREDEAEEEGNGDADNDIDGEVIGGSRKDISTSSVDGLNTKEGGADSSEVVNTVGKDKDEDEEIKAGSFSVGRPVQKGNTPRGNERFAALVDAVFDLEQILMPHRPPSTMAAINRRAQFLPHKDAGAGFGQSKSMIVGLGEYQGGQLAVEGDIYDIRYQPLEFDGWKQMHWTLPFEGERFSIVWFSPADQDGNV